MEPAEILCACGCGGAVPRAKFPSQQRRYIRHHQHRGAHNGNYRGGKIKLACAVCLGEFYDFPTKAASRVTCGKDECYRKWQGLTTSARGIHKVRINCASCGRELQRHPSLVNEFNFCDIACKQRMKGLQGAASNGNWKGGKLKFVVEQTRIRDDYRCVICGFHHSTDVHHITPVKQGGPDDVTNLVTVCPNHHRLAHIGLISLEPYRRLDWVPTLMVTPAPVGSASR